MEERERGAKAAMLSFIGIPDPDPDSKFTVSTLGVPGHSSVKLATLSSDSRFSIVFMRMHDGGQLQNLHPQSIYKLWLSQITSSCTVPTPTDCYTRQGLIDAMTWMLNNFAPGVVRSLDYLNDPVVDFDHPDHHSVGYFVNVAQASYASSHTYTGYRGYPTGTLPANVSGSELTSKEAAFEAYADYDSGGLGDPSDPASSYRWIFDTLIPKQYTVGGGEIRGLSNKCMDVEGPSASNNTSVQIWDCLGVGNQQWNVTMPVGGSGTIRGYANKCATAPLNAGSDVTMWDCNGGSNQSWLWTTGGEFRQGDRCIDVRGPSSTNGTNLQTYGCGGVSQQHWGVGTFQPAGIELHGVGGKCLDVEGPSTANGTAIQVFHCVGGSQQQWVYDTGNLQIRGLAGKCVTQSSTNIVLWDCGLGVSQQWLRTPEGYFKSYMTAQCIDILNPLGDGTNTVAYTCGGGGAKQKWAIAWFVSATIRPVSNTSVCLTASNLNNGTDTSVGACSGNVTWEFTSSYREIRIGSSCLDVEGGGAADGTKVQVWSCSSNGHPNERWRAEGYYVRWDNTAVNKCPTWVFGAVGLWNCTAYPSLQQWVYI